MQIPTALAARLAAIAVAISVAFMLAYGWIFRLTQISEPTCALMAMLIAAPVSFHKIDDAAGRRPAIVGAIGVSIGVFLLTLFLLTRFIGL